MPRIVWVLLAAWLTINGIFLQPFPTLGISSIDVVADHSSSTAVSDRALWSEPLQIPVLIKGQVARYAHRENTPPVSLQIASARTDEPIPNISGPTYNGHTAGERTNSAKRVRRKTEIIPHDVDIDLGHAALATFLVGS